MSVDLKALGISQEKIVELVVNQIVASVMSGTSYDEDGDEVRCDSSFSRRVEAYVKQAIDDKVAAIAEQHIVPTIGKTIDEFVIKKTNEYGEMKGEPVTFTEYLVSQADAWLVEHVDYEGNPVKNQRYGVATQTRLTHHVHRYLYGTIAGAMKDAVSGIGSKIGDAIRETTKIQLSKIAEAVQVTIEPK